MKRNRLLPIVMLSGLFCMSAAQAGGNFMQSAGVQGNGVYSPQYNPWRPQPQQWGYQNRQQNRQNNSNGNGYAAQTHNVMPQSSYAIPLSHIPARQYEYQRYVQQVNPYYNTGGGLPWWAGQGAAPYGPWSIGNGWPNGLR